MASFNKVILMGNLTRDPELRYTPKGTAIAKIGVAVNVDDPSGDPGSDRRLQVGSFGPTGGGVLSVRASWYISELEITASTGCHRG